MFALFYGCMYVCVSGFTLYCIFSNLVYFTFKHNLINFKTYVKCICKINNYIYTIYIYNKIHNTHYHIYLHLVINFSYYFSETIFISFLKKYIILLVYLQYSGLFLFFIRYDECTFFGSKRLNYFRTLR